MNECSENYRWNVFDVYGNIPSKVILKRYEHLRCSVSKITTNSTNILSYFLTADCKEYYRAHSVATAIQVDQLIYYSQNANSNK
jgi:hypothetical protein